MTEYNYKDKSQETRGADRYLWPRAYISGAQTTVTTLKFPTAEYVAAIICQVDV